MLKENKIIPIILKKYLNYLIVIKGFSINTVKAYTSDLMQFFNFIRKYKQIPIFVNNFNIFVLLKVETSDIIAFLVYLNYNKNNNPYTRQRKVTSIKSFYKWIFLLYPINELKVNPTINLEHIKKVVRFPKFLSLNQAKEIQNVFNSLNAKFPERNNTIISLFLSTGLRISELININLGDVNFENNSIRVIEKNNRERIVYFNDYCKNKILQYIETRKNSGQILDLKSPLFINRYGERIGVDGVEDICKKAYKLIGIVESGFTAHTLRHTSATLIYTYVKSDILLIKKFLGHSSLASTEIYTHLNNKKIKDAINNNPLNNYSKNTCREERS